MGFPLGTGTIIQYPQYEPVHLHISSVHWEQISLFVTVLQTAPYPGPTLDTAPQPMDIMARERSPNGQNIISSTAYNTLFSPYPAPLLKTLISIPLCTFQKSTLNSWIFFNRVNTSGLPPHNPYNCAVNLLPDTTPPCSQVYPLFISE